MSERPLPEAVIGVRERDETTCWFDHLDGTVTLVVRVEDDVLVQFHAKTELEAELDYEGWAA